MPESIYLSLSMLWKSGILVDDVVGVNSLVLIWFKYNCVKAVQESTEGSGASTDPVNTNI